ncbi:MAG: hypothetical protein WA996_21845 [Candidatus Promineifilaceae bacterium]
MSVIDLLAMAACYSPNPAVEPYGINYVLLFEWVNFDQRSGGVGLHSIRDAGLGHIKLIWSG